MLLIKEKCGLGLRGIHDMNLDFLAKLGWRMLCKKDSSWVRVIGGKYVRGNRYNEF